MSDQPNLSSDDWVTVYDRESPSSKHMLPKYEAKVVEDTKQQMEVVLLKETYSDFDGEHIYNFPKAVFERVFDGFPGERSENHVRS